MKYLENLSLENISNSLTNRSIGGGLVINGRIEVYSTKKAGTDKKESKILESKLNENGSPTVKTPKKLLVDLIQTLNASLVDYDFSDMSPDSFVLINANDAVQHINSRLSELSDENFNFISNMWKNIHECLGVSTLSSCEVYKLSESNGIEEEEGAAWTFNYFFCCKEMKRICYFTCKASNKFRRMNVSASVDGIASIVEDDEDSRPANYEDREGESGEEW